MRLKTRFAQMGHIQQRFSTFSDSRTTWQILSRFAAHPKKFPHFLGKISEDILKVIFPKFFLSSRTTKKNFANFPNFLAFFRVKDRKNSPISTCNLVSDSHQKFLNSQPCLRPTRQRSTAHWLRTADIQAFHSKLDSHLTRHSYQNPTAGSNPSNPK